MFKLKEPDFIYFDEQWNEPTTDKDVRGDYYDTDFNDGIDDYILIKPNTTSIED
tara:strand:- start:515 stop:676 length:162 start_codon:yes stop_codon:yes gene_type:complete